MENFEAKKKMLIHDGHRRDSADNSDDDDDLADHDADDTKCGYWLFKGPFFQRLANKNVYVFLFGLLGCLYSASYAYFNGIISTVEKRYGIPSRVSGLITCGNDVSQVFISVFVTYYASRKHKPRWIGFGGYSVVIFCLMSALPHFIFGPGNDSYDLTKEMGGQKNPNISSSRYFEILEDRKMLCKDKPRKCDPTGDNVIAPILLFLAQFISGIGQTLFHSVGISYLDDNVKRSNVPIMLSFSYFIRGLGPVAGYLLCSLCLKLYIVPGLTPTITTDDPRWLGAWWLGWLVLAVLVFVVSTLITLFPKRLPHTGESIKKLSSGPGSLPPSQQYVVPKPSYTDMIETFKRLFKNKPLMYNNLSSVFYILGLMPFYIFLPKYLEMIYAKSASLSNLVTGTVTLAFSAIGIFSSGIILSKYKPKARYLAAWNIIAGIIIALGIFSFAFISCSDLVKLKHVYSNNDHRMECSNNCHCEYVKYTPVCSMDGKTRFVSPCHAGCTSYNETKKLYSGCSCVSSNIGSQFEDPLWNRSDTNYNPGHVVPGLCDVNCQSAFILFLVVLCALQLIGSSSRTTNFLVAIRCVDEQDKSMSIGLGLTIISLASFIPSPIIFGYIIDKCCLYWGATCSGKGYCWIYDIKRLKYVMNFTATFFIVIGVVFDVCVWYYVKDTQIFNEEIHRKEHKRNSSSSDIIHKKQSMVTSK